MKIESTTLSSLYSSFNDSSNYFHSAINTLMGLPIVGIRTFHGLL